MRLNLESEVQTEVLFSFDPQQTAQDVAEAALAVCRCPYEAQVSMLLTDADAIREMNRDNRGIDRVTDVLSFPMIDWEEPCAWNGESLAAQSAFYPGTDELVLGDIVICVPRLIEQAAEYGHSRRREFAFLTAHSMLHLCGYDHMTSEDAVQMEALQNRILEDLGITRDLPD